VIGWIIVALWTRVLDNFTYGFLGLDQNSTWDALLITIPVTIFFIFLINAIDNNKIINSNTASTSSGSIEGGVSGDIISEQDPFSAFADPDASSEQLRNIVEQPFKTNNSTFFPGFVVR